MSYVPPDEKPGRLILPYSDGEGIVDLLMEKRRIELQPKKRLTAQDWRDASEICRRGFEEAGVIFSLSIPFVYLGTVVFHPSTMAHPFVTMFFLASAGGFFLAGLLRLLNLYSEVEEHAARNDGALQPRAPLYVNRR